MIQSMARPSTFLTAEWRNLLMLNYAVDPSLLAPYVPTGTELDFFDGQTYISLIGFEFNRTRVLGVAIPFHQDFEEVNVRFYVRREEGQGIKRGVVFISEKYTRVPMAHRIDLREDAQIAGGEFSWRLGREACVMQIETEGPAFLPAPGSEAEFITEHYWGYASQADGACLEYQVQHPQWQVWNAKRASFTGNAESIYGPQIAAVLTRLPSSAFLAEGSAVTVSKGTRIA